MDTVLSEDNLHVSDVNFTSGISSSSSQALLTTVQPSETGSGDSPDPITDSILAFFEVINYAAITGVISFFGSIANVINMAVFYRQKFADSVNVSLFGLALSDLGALLTLLWMGLCYNPLFNQLDLTFDPLTVQYLTSGWTHVCFARITSYITAYVTLERCLCVTLPLKVKAIITPKRTATVVSFIFLFMFASVGPVFWAIRIGPVQRLEQQETSPSSAKPNASNNTTQSTSTQLSISVNESEEASVKTIISLVYLENSGYFENISFSINVFTQISSFVMVILCTVILVRTLAKNSKWRDSNSSGSNTDSKISSKDKRLLKMVIFLATIFIVCFLPTAVNILVIICMPEYSFGGTFSNSFQAGWSFFNILEAVNSSVNIFVYYKMSSRYKKTLREMVGLSDDKDDPRSTSATE